MYDIQRRVVRQSVIVYLTRYVCMYFQPTIREINVAFSDRIKPSDCLGLSQRASYNSLMQDFESEEG